MRRVVVLSMLVSCLVAVPLTLSPPSDAEYKPLPPNNNVGFKITSADDSYTPVGSPVSEPVVPGDGPVEPQIGNLVQIQDDAPQPQNSPLLESVTPKDPTTATTTLDPPAPSIPIQEISVTQPEAKPAANKATEFYPITTSDGVLAYKESSEVIAGPPKIDPTGQNVNGVPSADVKIERPEEVHPMEAVTPLGDANPCDPNRILEVNVPAAINGILPSRYGCSSATDGSREKISPEVSWTNIYNDVEEFSVQMVQLSDKCDANSADYGKIHWHVTNIKRVSNSFTLQEGASHDSRLLGGGVEQPNQWLENYYSGPCPPRGAVGCYRFKVLAHRKDGWCQCGFKDVHFERPYGKEDPWVYEPPTELAPAVNGTAPAVTP